MTTPTNQPTIREKRAISALKKLQREWPKGLWLFATGNSLHLMRTHPDGTRHKPGKPSDGMDPDLVVETFKIPNDGGDW